MTPPATMLLELWNRFCPEAQAIIIAQEQRIAQLEAHSILSVVASCRSQGRSVYGFSTEAVTAQIEQTTRPFLLPVGA